MSNPTVYAAVKFRPEDTRTYTYEWSGEPLMAGDQVKVPDNRSDGWKRVTVVSVSDQAPSFACKPILGKVEPEPHVERDVFDALDRTAAETGADPLSDPVAF